VMDCVPFACHRGGVHPCSMAIRDVAHTVGGEAALASEPRVDSYQFLRLGLALTFIVLVLASLRFARYDWTGYSMTLLPDSLEQVISSDGHLGALLDCVRPERLVGA
jgi:hypothetical protein